MENFIILLYNILRWKYFNLKLFLMVYWIIVIEFLLIVDILVIIIFVWFFFMFIFVIFVRNLGGLLLIFMIWIIILGEVVNKGGFLWFVYLILIYI